MTKPPSSSHCSGRYFTILGHRWEAKFWDKFGVGRRTERYWCCAFCGETRGLR